ncbi:MAG: response regulator [Leptolyngbyaceae cyanobacterium SL_7_1]|nr:response regulator [Leptolyngbyaceae cyanobacterium SL_7_1]
MLKPPPESFPTPSNLALILVIDDDPTMRELLYQTLIRQGYCVMVASNGIQAIEEFRRCPPDLVLLDAQMPELNGFDCCRRLRQLSPNRFLPILMLTSLNDTGSIDQAFAAGVSDYLTKPFNLAILLQRIQHLLQSSQAMAEEVEACVQQQTAKLQTRLEDLKLLLEIRMISSTQFPTSCDRPYLTCEWRSRC